MDPEDMGPEQTRAWFRQTLDRIRLSRAFILIAPSDEGLDFKVSAELGAAILSGKQIWIMLPPGRDLPAGLRNIATEVVNTTGDPATDAEMIAEAVKRREAN